MLVCIQINQRWHWQWTYDIICSSLILICNEFQRMNCIQNHNFDMENSPKGWMYCLVAVQMFGSLGPYNKLRLLYNYFVSTLFTNVSYLKVKRLFICRILTGRMLCSHSKPLYQMRQKKTINRSNHSHTYTTYIAQEDDTVQ